MEQQQLILWILGIFIPVFIGWAAWITVKTNNNSEAIAVNNARDEHLAKEVVGIKDTLDSNQKDMIERLTDLKKEMKEAIGVMSHRLDTVFGNEFQWMKNVISQQNENR